MTHARNQLTFTQQVGSPAYRDFMLDVNNTLYASGSPQEIDPANREVYYWFANGMSASAIAEQLIKHPTTSKP